MIPSAAYAAEGISLFCNINFMFVIIEKYSIL